MTAIPKMRHTRLARWLGCLLSPTCSLAFSFLLVANPSTTFAKAGAVVFEDNFSSDDSQRYLFSQGIWNYERSSGSLSMKKALNEENESMWAIRDGVETPSAFVFSADFTANGQLTSAALGLKDPKTGAYVMATLMIYETETGEGWVKARINYSYEGEPWGYLEESAKSFSGSTMGKTFHLVLTRSLGSNILTFSVAEGDIGELETKLDPDETNAEGKLLSGQFVESLNRMSQIGLFGYDAAGLWDNVRLVRLDDR